MSVKTEVLQTIGNLPEDAGYEDVIYAIYVRERIALAEREIAERKVLTEDEVKARLSKWLQ